MPKIQLTKLTCLDQQEAGSDEVYFIFQDNGGHSTHRTNVMGSLDEEKGAEYHTVYPTDTFSFTGSVDLLLYEDDDGGDVFDELIDVKEIGALGPGHATFVNHDLGAKYYLEYTVLP
jgi:hypothetical protein